MRFAVIRDGLVEPTNPEIIVLHHGMRLRIAVGAG
jgi:hypothetical protein